MQLAWLLATHRVALFCCCVDCCLGGLRPCFGHISIFFHLLWGYSALFFVSRTQRDLSRISVYPELRNPNSFSNLTIPPPPTQDLPTALSPLCFFYTSELHVFPSSSTIPVARRGQTAKYGGPKNVKHFARTLLNQRHERGHLCVPETSNDGR